MSNTVVDAHWQLCRLLTHSASYGAYSRDLYASFSDQFWIEFTELANRSLVTPAVWLALQNSHLTALVPSGYQDYLRASYEWNVARNGAIQDELTLAISALNELSIIPVLLKGASYIKDGTYPTIGARILGDLDILVEADHIGAAVQVFQSLGYSPAGIPGRSYKCHHHTEPLMKSGCQAYVEIHREAVAGPLACVLPARDIISDAQVYENGYSTYAVPSPTHSATISFLHSQITDGCDATARINIRSLMDLAQLNNRYRGSINWDGMLDTMEAHGLSNPLRNYFYSLEQFAGLATSSQRKVYIRQKFHFMLVNASLRIGWLEKLITILDEFSEQRIRERYILDESGRSARYLRMRHLAYLIKRILGRQAGRL
jgi:hypothetical protein